MMPLTAEVIQKALGEFPEIAQGPQPLVGIQEFGDSSINIGLRYWVPTDTYFKLRYRANLAVYKHLRAKDIEIPFPQRDVHVVSRSPEGLRTTV